MGKILSVCLLHLLPICFIFGQGTNLPSFAAFDKKFKEQTFSWSNSKEELSRVFNEERARLGERFESELWKYIGDDSEKYYWIALFLDSKAYLYGGRPLPELAFSIRQEALKLIQNKTDTSYLVRKNNLLIMMAVSSEQLGKRETARLYKKEAELIANSNSNVKKYLPVLSRLKQCLYERINENIIQCADDDPTPVSEGIIPAAVVKGEAENLVQPKYPKNARKKNVAGTVNVQVVIDEQGNVTSAEAIEGPKVFYEAAEKAALQSKFKPTTLYGEAVRVTGLVVYNFVK